MQVREPFGDLRVDGGIILKDLNKIGRYFVEWVHLAKDIDWWHPVMNRAVNLQDFQKAQVP
jgi:hypothetical protein